MSAIFLCYRRDDAAGYVHALRERLAARLGPTQVFMDIDSIEPGLDFEEVIQSTVTSCDVVIALIGKRWLQPERLQDSRDFVRLEIQTALEKKIRVIPVLLDGAQMPKTEALPAELAPLSRRQAFEITNRRFSDDIDELADLVQRILRDREPKEVPSPSPTLDEPAAVTSPEALEEPSVPAPTPQKVTTRSWSSVLAYTLSIIASLLYAWATFNVINDLSSALEDIAEFFLVLINDSFLLSGWVLRYRRSAHASRWFIAAGFWQIVILMATLGIMLPDSAAEAFGGVAIFASCAFAFFLLAYRLKKKPASS